jgi:hypothetical protein
MAERRVWVLDTDTKGTGAEMRPLEETQRKPGPSAEPFWVPPKRRPRAPEPVPPRGPRRFRIVDVLSRETLADDVDARTALRVLSGLRSSVDANVYVWEPEKESWRMLTLAEQRVLWERRAA